MTHSLTHDLNRCISFQAVVCRLDVPALKAHTDTHKNYTQLPLDL